MYFWLSPEVADFDEVFEDIPKKVFPRTDKFLEDRFSKSKKHVFGNSIANFGRYCEWEKTKKIEPINLRLATQDFRVRTFLEVLAKNSKRKAKA